jgi:hypothetical protein
MERQSDLELQGCVAEKTDVRSTEPLGRNPEERGLSTCQPQENESLLKCTQAGT